MKPTLHVAYGSIASIPGGPVQVRFTPNSDRIADILERQKSASFGLVHRSKSALLDDLVSAPKYVDGEGKPQRSCGLEVDDEF